VEHLGVDVRRFLQRLKPTDFGKRESASLSFFLSALHRHERQILRASLYFSVLPVFAA
jgi:hypothetical protein